MMSFIQRLRRWLRPASLSRSERDRAARLGVYFIEAEGYDRQERGMFSRIVGVYLNADEANDRRQAPPRHPTWEDDVTASSITSRQPRPARRQRGWGAYTAGFAAASRLAGGGGGMSLPRVRKTFPHSSAEQARRSEMLHLPMTSSDVSVSCPRGNDAMRFIEERAPGHGHLFVRTLHHGWRRTRCR